MMLLILFCSSFFKQLQLLELFLQKNAEMKAYLVCPKLRIFLIVLEGTK